MLQYWCWLIFYGRHEYARGIKKLGRDDIETTHVDLSGLNKDVADHFFVGKDMYDAVAHVVGEENVTALDSIIDKEELQDKIKNYLDSVAG